MTQFIAALSAAPPRSKRFMPPSHTSARQSANASKNLCTPRPLMMRVRLLRFQTRLPY